MRGQAREVINGDDNNPDLRALNYAPLNANHHGK